MVGHGSVLSFSSSTSVSERYCCFGLICSGDLEMPNWRKGLIQTWTQYPNFRKWSRVQTSQFPTGLLKGKNLIHSFTWLGLLNWHISRKQLLIASSCLCSENPMLSQNQEFQYLAFGCLYNLLVSNTRRTASVHTQRSGRCSAPCWEPTVPWCY